MKKVFLALVFIIISTIAYAQITIRPGVRSGVNFSNLTNTDYNDKVDLYLGAFAAVKFVHFYTLQPELNYSRQGASSKFSEVNDIEIQYVGFTLTNKFSPFKEIGINAVFGPSINIKVGDNIRGDTEYVDFLLFGGLGYDFPFGLGIEARYNLGLIDILGNSFDFDDDDDYYDDNDNYLEDIVLNQVFQIGLTYKFDF